MEVAELLCVAIDPSNPRFSEANDFIVKKTEAFDTAFLNGVLGFLSTSKETPSAFIALAIIGRFYSDDTRAIRANACALVMNVVWKYLGASLPVVRREACRVIGLIARQRPNEVVGIGLVQQLIALLDVSAGPTRMLSAIDTLEELYNAEIVPNDIGVEVLGRIYNIIANVREVDILTAAIRVLRGMMDVITCAVETRSVDIAGLVSKCFELFAVHGFIDVIRVFHKMVSRCEVVFTAVERELLRITMSLFTGFDNAMKGRTAPADDMALKREQILALVMMWEKRIKCVGDEAMGMLAVSLVPVCLSLMQNSIGAVVSNVIEWEVYTGAESIVRTCAELGAPIVDIIMSFIGQFIRSTDVGARRAAIECITIVLCAPTERINDAVNVFIGAVVDCLGDGDAMVQYRAAMCALVLLRRAGIARTAVCLDGLFACLDSIEPTAFVAAHAIRKFARDGYQDFEALLGRVARAIGKCQEMSPALPVLYGVFHDVPDGFLPTGTAFLVGVLRECDGRRIANTEILVAIFSGLVLGFTRLPRLAMEHAPVLIPLLERLYEQFRLADSLAAVAAIAISDAGLFQRITPVLLGVVNKCIAEQMSDAHSMKTVIMIGVRIALSEFGAPLLGDMMNMMITVAEGNGEAGVVIECLNAIEWLIEKYETLAAGCAEPVVRLVSLCMEQIDEHLDSESRDQHIAQIETLSIALALGARSEGHFEQVRRMASVVIERADRHDMCDKGNESLSIVNLVVTLRRVAPDLMDAFVNAPGNPQGLLYRGLLEAATA